MTTNFWSVIHNQIADLRDAKSADDVIRILSHERNPYRLDNPNWNGMDGAADGFFAGGSGDDVWESLIAAGWARLWDQGTHYFALRAPDGSMITYCEGDVYKGDRRPTAQEG